MTILDVAGVNPRTLERLLAQQDHVRPQFGALSQRQESELWLPHQGMTG